MARKGAFKSEKRKKELIRQKKQEEKRKKRLHKDPVTGEIVETTENPDTPAAEGEEAAPEAGTEESREQEA